MTDWSTCWYESAVNATCSAQPVLQTVAAVAGVAQPTKSFMSIHTKFGPWFALRAVVLHSGIDVLSEGAAGTARALTKSPSGHLTQREAYEHVGGQILIDGAFHV